MLTPRRCRWAAAVLCAGVVGTGCRAIAIAPDVDAVDPPWGFNGEDTTVRVVGADFLPASTIAASGDSFRDDGFEVALVDGGVSVGLDVVTWLDRSALEIVVPAGLTVGTYDVAVTDPRGQVGRLADGFEVRDTRVDALDIQVDRVVAEVFENVDLTLQVVDPSGRPVSQDLRVALRFEAEEDGTAPIEWEATGLEAIRPTTLGLEGQLGDDGVAVIALRATSPGPVRVTAVSTGGEVPVRSDDVTVEWTRGSALGVDVTLPSPDFEATVGDAFEVVLRPRDAFGNPAPDVVFDAVLAEVCGGLRQDVRVQGDTVVEVSMQRASGRPSCDDNGLEVLGAVSGASEPFDVEPGLPNALFVITTGQASLVAGDRLTVTVSAFDAFGNVTPYSGRIDEVLDGADPAFDVACSAPGQGISVACSVQIVRAGGARVLTVVDEDGLTGSSTPYEVTAAEADHLLVTPAESRWTAGELVEVGLRAEDAWGNDLGVPPVGAVAFTDDRGAVPCTPSGEGTWACRRDEAGEDLTLTATAVIEGVSASGMASFHVDNAGLAALGVSVSSTDVRAGDRVDVQVQAEDAFGNPWVVRTGGETASVSSPSAEGGAVSAVLDAAAQANLSLRLVQAGTATITATVTTPQGGAEGSKGGILVRAGTATSLQVSFPRPWVASGEVTTVRAETKDAYGNRASLSGNATISSQGGGFVPVPLVLVNGVGLSNVTWSSAVGVDRVRVDGPGTVDGHTDVIVYRACGNGPAARLSMRGDASDRSCLVDGVAVGEADLSASTPFGAASFVAYGVYGPDGPHVATSPILDVESGASGIYVVEGIVLQDDGCAAEVEDTWYVGRGAGEPAGRVQIDASSAVVDLEDADPGVDFTLRGVSDCTGAVLSGVPLRVHASAGTLGPAGVVPTGEGLVVTTSGTGTATVHLDLSSVEAPGTVEIRAGGNAAVRGSQSVDVIGDFQLPEVRSWSPRGGGQIDPITVVRVGFSEAMDPATVVASAATVTGAGSSSVVGAVAVNDHTWDFVLDPALLPGTGLSALRLAATVTDPAGNPLAGTWSDLPAPFVGPFGGDAQVDAVTACVPDLDRFRPDGDPGDGEEADAVGIAITAPSTPSWWLLRVLDAEGRTVRTTWEVPSGPTDVWQWDGRGDTQRLVEAGTYTIQVQAEGSNGDRGTACTAAVGVVR